MSMVDTLFGLIPQASTGQQWVARDLQLVNWGGYDGHHRVRLAPTATLLSGGSGSGKSTLMDAYIALLMPHTTPFNGASNGGVVGRPRGKDQRNILSYARGKLDESRTQDGTRQRVLRGDGQDTWSAIAMTWADQAGRELTAVRAWYVPGAARTLEDVTAVRATCDGGFDLRELEPAAADRFGRASLAAAGLTPFDTDREFTARLHTTLGIGATGDGAKAVALLGRIQAGQQITTVDALYKAMVLEEPSTFATADAVVEQFDKLSGTREQMITARQQVKALEPIRAHRAAIEEAAERLRVIASVGGFDDGTSPAALWRHERRLGLLRAVEAELQHRHEGARRESDELTARIAAARAELDGVKETLWVSGGDRLARAQRELRAAEEKRDRVAARRGRLDAVLADTLGVGVGIASAADFAELTERARTALADAGAKKAAQERLGEAMAARKEARAELAELQAERAAAEKQQGAVPTDLLRARAALAEAAGLTPEELPFVAELIEVRTEHEPWREAFNLALGGFATLLLIDAARLGAFRKAIDGVRLGRRLRYEGVPTGQRSDVALDPRTLPGRLELRAGPFSGWLRGELASRHAYVCVDTPGELSQHPKALTRAGQVSEGLRGAHGGQGRANVLGFTNARRLAHLDGQIERVQHLLALAERGVEDAAARLDEQDGERRGYEALVEVTWEDVDVAAADAERARWAQVIEDVTSGNPEVVRLQRRADELTLDVQVLTESVGRSKGETERLGAGWSAVSDDVDVAQQALDEAQDAGTTAAPEQRAYLERLLGGPGAGADGATGRPAEALAAFDATVARAADLLRADRQAAQDVVSASREALRRTFETFVERWPDPNLGTDPDGAYADYERILTALETNGLHELEAEWRKSLLRLSGNDLADLHHALSRSVREIKERIQPVNEILTDLPFADDDHRLRIDARDTQSTVVARFRKELRDLREVLATDATDAERERRYLRMAKVIDRIRRTAPDFADLVDVRRHVRLSAEKIDLDGNHVALYDHIGEKSGGESQELVAFIVGAALRYQLGDAGAARPRYAPVFLDEALIKADARFTGRAVGAWRGLGFQLVIGAPNDKFSALEPHVDLKYVVLKDAEGRSRTKPLAGLPEGYPAP